MFVMYEVPTYSAVAFKSKPSFWRLSFFFFEIVCVDLQLLL